MADVNSVFARTHGARPPWVCIFCGRDIMIVGHLHRHHLDGNRENNSEENLQPSHRSCHIGYHALIRNWAISLGISLKNPLEVERAWARRQAAFGSQERGNK